MSNAPRRHKSYIWHGVPWLLSMVIVATVMNGAMGATICHVSAVGPGTITCAENPVTPIHVKATEETDKTALTKLGVGSIIEPPVADMAARDIKVATVPFNGWFVLAIVFGVVAACVYVSLITGDRMPLVGLRVLIIGQDNRYSNSKVQAVAWMGVLLIVYMATAWVRWWSGLSWQIATSVGISENLLALAAVSAATAGGAKITTGVKAAATGAAAIGGLQPVVPGPTKTTNPTAPRLADLFRNDQGEWDIGDAQMIIMTLISIVFFVVDVGILWSSLPLSAHVELPAPTNTLTFAFGGSLGGYLAKKIGGTVGLS